MAKTKSALLSSAISLLLCFTMLVGTTFAWFTDSVTSANNIITAGNLDISLEYYNGTDWVDVNGASAIFKPDAKWEPGYTEVVYLKLANEGDLDLKYKLGVNILSETDGTNKAGSTFKLSDFIYMDVVESASFDKLADRAAADGVKSETKKISQGFAKEKVLEAGAAPLYLALVVYMPEWVGNDANHNGVNVPNIQLGISVAATQAIGEFDSFGSDYDTDSEYPESVNKYIPENTTEPTPITNGIVTTTVPAGAPKGDYTLTVSNKNVTTDSEGKTTVALDIDLKKDGAKITNDGTLYTVELALEKGMEVTEVTHKGVAISDFNYDPNSGILKFTTTDFSPFTASYVKADEESVFVPSNPEASDKLEEAEVVAVDEDGNGYASFAAAINSGAAKIYVKEGADLGTVTHLDLDHSVTIYGNGASIVGDLAIDFNVKTQSDITVTIFNLHGIAVWGYNVTEYTKNVNIYNCNDSRIYLTGTAGTINVGFFGCNVSEAIDGDTAIYSNANGTINVEDCTFTNECCIVNLNHKVAGTQIVNAINNTFVDCATTGDAAYYAPIRLYNSVENAKQVVSILGNTFSYSEGKAPINKADVLLNAKHNNVDAAGSITAAVQAGALVSAGANVDYAYEIYTAEDLYWFAGEVNKYSNYERPFEGVTVKLMNDIDLEGAEWTPIGDYRFAANRFCGTFDGQDNVISNFKITKKTDKSDANKSSYGFFGNMEGTVKNLIIDNANITSYAYVGALVGRLTNGTVIDCEVRNSSVETTYWQAGGMIGQLNDNCTVKGCKIVNSSVTGASAIGAMFGPVTATNSTDGTEKTLLFENNEVIDCTVIQKGSFGASYDVLFGAMFCDIEADDNRTDINNCTVSGTTVKGAKASELYGTLSGSKVYFDGYKYITNGLLKADDSNTYCVTSANGLEAMHAMMSDKSAGKNTKIIMLADIDFSGKTWTPIDSHADTAFSLAEIDGNYHTISNLTINGQAMFNRFAGSGDVVIKNLTFDNATVNSTTLNSAIITGHTYQNVLLDNVDVKNSTITGAYKVAPLIGTVYNESSSSITATLKNCDVSNTSVTCTSYDFSTTGMVAFVYEGDNDKIEFENCSVTDVKLYANPNGYAIHAWIYTNDADTDDCFNEAEGVTVSGCTFEALN